jgi:hypothetical protein
MANLSALKIRCRCPIKPLSISLSVFGLTLPLQFHEIKPRIKNGTRLPTLGFANTFEANAS